MIDVLLWLRGWTYSEPAQRGLGLAFDVWGLDLQRISVGGWWGSAPAWAGHMTCCSVHLHSLGQEHNLGLKSFN